MQIFTAKNISLKTNATIFLVLLPALLFTIYIFTGDKSTLDFLKIWWVIFLIIFWFVYYYRKPQIIISRSGITFKTFWKTQFIGSNSQAILCVRDLEAPAGEGGMWVKPSLIFEVEDSNPPKILAMSSIKDFWTPDTLRGLSEAIAENDLKIKIDTSFDRWLNHNQRTGFKRYELGIWGWRWYRK